jgi:hypothetical protein
MPLADPHESKRRALNDKVSFSEHLRTLGCQAVKFLLVPMVVWKAAVLSWRQLVAQELVGLSLWGNNIETTSALLEAVGGLTGLRALWLNENPVCKSG